MVIKCTYNTFLQQPCTLGVHHKLLKLVGLSNKGIDDWDHPANQARVVRGSAKAFYT